jgi:hypothetical protein
MDTADGLQVRYICRGREVLFASYNSMLCTVFLDRARIMMMNVGQRREAA